MCECVSAFGSMLVVEIIFHTIRSLSVLLCLISLCFNQCPDICLALGTDFAVVVP